MRAKWVYCSGLLLTGVASWLVRDYAPKALLAFPDTFDYCAIPGGAGGGGEGAEASLPGVLAGTAAAGNGTEAAAAALQQPAASQRRSRRLTQEEAATAAVMAPSSPSPLPTQSLGPLASITGLLAAALPEGMRGLLSPSSSAAANGTATTATASPTTTTNSSSPSSPSPLTAIKDLITSPSILSKNLAKHNLVNALAPEARRRLEACVGRQAAVRVSFASACFFLSHALLLACCARDRDPRAGLHSSLLGPRLFLWAAAIVACFFLPQPTVAGYAQAARAGAALFLVFAMVECVHSFYDANRWLLDKQRWWAWTLLVTGAVIALGGGFAAIGAAFWYYAPTGQPGCRLNTLFCALSVVAGALMVLVLFVPGRRAEAGLLTSGAVLLYGTWLLFSALSGAPRVVGGGGGGGGGIASAVCVPRLGGVSDRATVIAGFFVGIAAVCYSTLNVGTSAVWAGRPTPDEDEAGGGVPVVVSAMAESPDSPVVAFPSPGLLVMEGRGGGGYGSSSADLLDIARDGGAHGGGDGFTSFVVAGGGGASGGSSSPATNHILGRSPKAAAAAARPDAVAAVYLMGNSHQGRGGAKAVPVPAAAVLMAADEGPAEPRGRGRRGGGGSPLPPIVASAYGPAQQAALGRGQRLAYRPDMFHLVYALAAMYLAMLFTNWEVAAAVVKADEEHGVAVAAGGGAGGAAGGNDASAAALAAAFQFGGGWASVWVKMATKWFCEALYLWTVLAPCLCGRFRDFRSAGAA
jgi:hypothetical protein